MKEATRLFPWFRRSTGTNYVDGVSVTHGYPHQHIWTLSNGLDELSTTYSYATCPCVTGNINGNLIPAFVGKNYFCETGITQWTGNHIFHPDGIGNLYGMDRGVVQLAPAAPSTHHHGSM